MKRLDVSRKIEREVRIMKTVVGTYDNIDSAYAAANDLVSAGYNRNDISVVATNNNNVYSPYIDNKVETKVVDTTDDVGTGAGVGAALAVSAAC